MPKSVWFHRESPEPLHYNGLVAIDDVANTQATKFLGSAHTIPTDKMIPPKVIAAFPWKVSHFSFYPHSNYSRNPKKRENM